MIEYLDLSLRVSGIEREVDYARDQKRTPVFSERKPSAEDFLRLARALVVDHPDDLYARVMLLDALSVAKDATALERDLEAWRGRFAACRPLLAAFRRLERSLRAQQLTAAGQNARDFLMDVLGRGTDLTHRIERFPLIRQCTGYAAPQHLGGTNPPDFLEIQIATKVFMMQADFMLLRGEREQALDLLTSSFYMGQLLTNNDVLIVRLIGIAGRSIALRGLEIFMNNACETVAEIENLWGWLETLNAAERVPTPAEFMKNEPGGVLFAEDEWTSIPLIRANIDEWLTRARVTHDKFQLLRLAAAARHRFLLRGHFPKTVDEFEPLLQTLPQDAFTSQPLHSSTGDRLFTAWSPGPDKADDGGTIDYDPTNGTTSRGDLTLRTFVERPYPFPRGGVRAASRADLLRQFPHELPPDPFADTRNQPLKVSDTRPVCVFSWGPDTDECVVDPNLPMMIVDGKKVRAVPEVTYDPTNGTTSDGDLVTVIPER